MTDTMERREAIARLLCEQHGGDPDAVASEEHDCWDGPLWTVFVKDADAILALTPSPRVDEGREVASPVDDEMTRAFIDGWNARLDHSDFDMALHFWMRDSAGIPAAGLPPAQAFTPSPRVDEGRLPRTCDGVEQDAFEAWAEANHFDMHLHPLHWLFLNPETSAARKGWRAGLEHAVERVKASLATQPPADPRVEKLGEAWKARQGTVIGVGDPGKPYLKIYFHSSSEAQNFDAQLHAVLNRLSGEGK